MAVEEQTDVSRGFSSISQGTSFGQRLTITNRTVSKLSLYLIRVGSPGGTVTFSIRAVSGDTVLLTKLQGNANDISTSAAWYEVEFDTPININEEVYLLVTSSSGGVGNLLNVYDSNGVSVKASEYMVQRSAGGTYTRYDGTVNGSNGAGLDSDFGYKYTYEISATPTVTTQAVTSISGTTATGNGNITSLGVPDPTAHGVCYVTEAVYDGGNHPPTIADSTTDEGAASATGAFTSAMSVLTAGIKYILRGYATNSQGTSYGNEVEFTANKGTVFPIDPLLRTSGIVRTFWAGIGGQSVYQTQLMLGGLESIYISPISKREPESAVKPQELPTGAGYTQVDFQRWLASGVSPGLIQAIFGHFPTYEEWLKLKAAGGLP